MTSFQLGKCISMPTAQRNYELFLLQFVHFSNNKRNQPLNTDLSVSTLWKISVAIFCPIIFSIFIVDVRPEFFNGIEVYNKTMDHPLHSGAIRYLNCERARIYTCVCLSITICCCVCASDNNVNSIQWFMMIFDNNRWSRIIADHFHIIYKSDLLFYMTLIRIWF